MSDVPLVWVFVDDPVKSTRQALTSAPVASTPRGSDQALNLIRSMSLISKIEREMTHLSLVADVAGATRRHFPYQINIVGRRKQRRKEAGRVESRRDGVRLLIIW